MQDKPGGRLVKYNAFNLHKRGDTNKFKTKPER